MQKIIIYLISVLPLSLFLGVLGYIEYDQSKGSGGWDGGYAIIGLYSLITTSIFSVIVAVYLFQFQYKSNKNRIVMGSIAKLITIFIPLSFSLCSVFVYLFMLTDLKIIFIPLGIALSIPAIYIINGLFTFLSSNKNA